MEIKAVFFFFSRLKEVVVFFPNERVRVSLLSKGFS